VKLTSLRMLLTLVLQRILKPWPASLSSRPLFLDCIWNFETELGVLTAVTRLKFVKLFTPHEKYRLIIITIYYEKKTASPLVSDVIIRKLEESVAEILASIHTPARSSDTCTAIFFRNVGCRMYDMCKLVRRGDFK
jgi:hypothetical protein